MDEGTGIGESGPAGARRRRERADEPLRVIGEHLDAILGHEHVVFDDHGQRANRLDHADLIKKAMASSGIA